MTQSNVDLAKEYLTLLFGDRVKERLVEELNPLKQVEVSLVRRDGSLENHYLILNLNVYSLMKKSVTCCVRLIM